MEHQQHGTWKNPYLTSRAHKLTPSRLVIAACTILFFGATYYALLHSEIPSDSILRTYRLYAASGYEQPTFNNFFVFGDSYTAQPWEERSREIPFLINKFKVDGQWKRKPYWTNFLAEEHIGTDPDTVNFAEGGSTTDHDIIKPGLFGTSLIKQSDTFVKAYVNETSPLHWQPENTLFLIAFGVNDMIGAHEGYDGTMLLTPLPLPGIFASYQASLEKLYDAGARHFLLMTIAPIDRALPAFGTEMSMEKKKVAFGLGVAAYNARLFNTAIEFRYNHPDAIINVFDQNRLYASAIDAPQQYPETANVKYTVDLCRDAIDDQQIGRLDWDYTINICQSGHLSQEYIWHPIHASYPIHNLTAVKIAEDCYGPGGPTGFCW